MGRPTSNAFGSSRHNRNGSVYGALRCRGISYAFEMVEAWKKAGSNNGAKSKNDHNDQ